MKTYIRIDDHGVVIEILSTIIVDGREVTPEERFTKEFIADLINVSDADVPAIGDIYRTGEFHS